MRKEEKVSVEDANAIKEMATRGVSSRLLFLLLAFGPLKQKRMQEILHSKSKGSGRISTVLKDLLKYGLIECAKKPHKEFKALEIFEPPEKKWRGVFWTKPIYGQEESMSTINTITFKWLSPLYPTLTDSQKEFIKKTFERYARHPTSNEMTFDRDFDLYQILEQAINDLVIKRAVAKVLLGIDSEDLKQMDSNLLPKIKEKGPSELFNETKKILKKRNIPMTTQSEQLCLELISTPYEPSTQELLELAEPFVYLPMEGKNKNYKYSFVQGCYITLMLDKS